jgi:mRNA-degrading endonuclease YafQ of YafQ-DinJ toxin-antitoxin module
MIIRKIYYTPRFQKSWRKLPATLTKKAQGKENLFRRDAFQPSLLTHKLAAKLKYYWSFSIDYHTRIVFRFLKEGEVLFVDVGTHDIYK